MAEEVVAYSRLVGEVVLQLVSLMRDGMAIGEARVEVRVAMMAKRRVVKCMVD